MSSRKEASKADPAPTTTVDATITTDEATDPTDSAPNSEDPSSKHIRRANDAFNNAVATFSTQALQKADQILLKIPLLQQWKGRRSFLIAQGQISIVLAIAYMINSWPVSYPREDNHNEFMFWFMTLVMGGVAYSTLQHKKNPRGVQLLSRAQTEEWKGWMQFVFIMYHYYRNRTIYNEIRVLVSAYVWMTGFGHFLYCDKKQDFTVERMVSMWVRINYFPLLLSFCLGVPLDLYYVVPLHTVGFFMAMGTCYLAKVLKEKFPQHCPDSFKANAAAIGISLLVHILFFETPLHRGVLGIFSQEYVFRFATDKYSAWLGVLSGFMWSRFQAYVQWCYGDDEAVADSAEITSGTDSLASESPSSPSKGTSKQNPKKIQAMQIQRGVGAGLILVWLIFFGAVSGKDKHVYNPQHPYVFWMPVAGWLMLRNSSKYLTELHSTALEFLGRITLETYVLQFHVFMCRNVQYIPVVIPGSGANGFFILKVANMLITGVGFLAVSWYARTATVKTQEAITELVTVVRNKHFGGGGNTNNDGEGPMQTKPTLGIIQEPEEVSPLKPASDKKTDEEAA